MADYDDYYDSGDYRDYDPYDFGYDDSGDEYDDYNHDDYTPGDEYEYDDPNETDEESEDDVAELTARLSNLVVGKEYRRFGHFKCDKCNRSWKSAYAYCKYVEKEDGEKVFEPKKGSEQACQQCNTMYLPYRNDALKKSEGPVECPSHRADLCRRCLSGQPCRQSYR